MVSILAREAQVVRRPLALDIARERELVLAELKEIIRKPVTKNVERDEAGRILRVVET